MPGRGHDVVGMFCIERGQEVMKDWQLSNLNWIRKQNKLEKWCDRHVTSMEQRKNLSPRQELNLWPSIHWLDALTTELRRTCGELGHIQGSHMTCILRTAMIFTKLKIELAIIIYLSHTWRFRHCRSWQYAELYDIILKLYYNFF